MASGERDSNGKGKTANAESILIVRHDISLEDEPGSDTDTADPRPNPTVEEA